MSRRSRSGVTEDVDFDLHGFVGVRVLDATPRDAAVVERQLGPLRRPLDREPDITIRFVDRIPLTGQVTLVGRDDAAFCGDRFLVWDSLRGPLAELPLDGVGARCDIVCTRRAGPVPHLLAIVNQAALAHDVLPLHASAFVHDARGVLVTGWAKGGKTEVLLAFMRQGAAYVGDEWVYLDRDGAMFGVPEPIRLWHWQLRQLPDLWADLSRRQRTRLSVLAAAASAAQAGTRLPRAGGPLRRVGGVLARQPWVQRPPVALFGADRVLLAGRPEVVVLACGSSQPGVLVEEIDPDEVGARMRASLSYERAPLLAAYDHFRFAFPDRPSSGLERAGDRERDLLKAVLPQRALRLQHPYPPDIDGLFEPLQRQLAT
jgi:hypothetical protein